MMIPLIRSVTSLRMPWRSAFQTLRLSWKAVPIGRGWLVPASALLLTALATGISFFAQSARIGAALETAADQEVGRLETRLHAYVALLRATRAYVEAEGVRLDGAGFATFVEGLRIHADYPGMQGIGWSPRVGATGWQFRIVYLEPLDERNRAALGFDMHTEPVRAAAMDTARDQGAFAMSGSVILRQEIHADVSPGFLIYTPVYRGGVIPESVEARRRDLLGFVYAPFRASDFFRGVFQHGLVRLHALHTGSSGDLGALLYGDRRHPDRRAVTRTVTFGGQTWTLEFEAGQAPPWPDRLLPWIVLVAGLVVTALLLQLMRTLALARLRAEERSRDLASQVQFGEMLVGIVSHDLRNPLNVIDLNASLLERATLPESLQRSVGRIRSNTAMGLRMIRDLLDFTQGRLGGGIPVQRRSADMFFAMRQTVEQMRSSHPARRIELQLQGSGEGEWDIDRIAQVVANLVANALTYGREEAPIHVRAIGGPASVLVSVHNQGDPIPADILGSLFEPLRRGDGASGGESGNIGLGLYIVHQIVTAHGGIVTCDSDAARGTTFTIELPRLAGRQVDATPSV